jgi:hypothetical protein
MKRERKSLKNSNLTVKRELNCLIFRIKKTKLLSICLCSQFTIRREVNMMSIERNKKCRFRNLAKIYQNLGKVPQSRIH